MKIKSTHSNQLNSSLNLPNFTMYLVNTPNGLMVQWSDLYKSRLNLMVPVVFWHPSGLYFQSGFFHWIYSDPPGEAGHLWVGYDISPSMLKIAKSREVPGWNWAWLGFGVFFFCWVFEYGRSMIWICPNICMVFGCSNMEYGR
jgi:hypothetical protein